MIDLKFGLFWAGKRLSYLRYLTFKSLRYWHPNSDISLYVAKDYNSGIHRWGGEKQDFEHEDLTQENYIDRLKDLNVNVVPISNVGSPDYCAILQADLFRILWLKENGGFYLDTDQIILKSFKDLPLDSEFIYSRYMEVQCGDYFPTGCLGLQKDSRIADLMMEEVLENYSPNNYNSSGPFAFVRMARKYDLDKDYNSINVPSYYFYPINTSSLVENIYYGKYMPNNESYAMHWYGGHPMSQQFNKLYTEDKAKKSNDSISKIMREIK